MVIQKVIAVKDNYIVIRMSAGYLTQLGSSWSRERVCGRGGIRKNCGNLWKKVKSPRVGSSLLMLSRGTAVIFGCS
jgi:hypothetical protein